MSLGRCLLVACFSSVKNHNVSGPRLFSSVVSHAQKSLCLPRTVLQRAKKSLCNWSQFRTLFLPHRFIKISATRIRVLGCTHIVALSNRAIPKLNFLVSGRISVVMLTSSVFGLSYGRLDNEFSTALQSHLGQVEWFKWTDPLSSSHLSHEDLKTPFSLFHLSH